MTIWPRMVVCVTWLCVTGSILVAASERDNAAVDGPWPLHIIDSSSRGADGVRLADVNGDSLMDVTTGWEQGGVTRVYIHPGYAGVRQRWPAVTVGQTPSVEDAVFVDLDSDGAVDVISSCQGGTKRLFVHWAPPDKSDYLNPAGWRTEVFPACDGLTRWMFAAPMEVDGKYGIDIVAGGKDAAAQIGWLEAPAKPRSVSDYRWHPICPAGWIMSIILYDMDSDGDLDVAISDRFGPMRGCRWLQNPGTGPAQYQQWKNHFIGATGMEAMFMEIADLDDDKLDDIVVAVKPKSILYIRRLDATGLSWRQHEIALPDRAGRAKAVAVGDIDKDGRKDIVFTCENARGKHGVGWLSYQNAVTGEEDLTAEHAENAETGKINNILSADSAVSPVKSLAHSAVKSEWIHHDISGDKLGVKYDRIELLDLDGDGDLDVLTTEESQACPERSPGDGVGLGVIWHENPH